AASPLPGHVLADLGAIGRIVTLSIALAGILAVVVWLWRRPPHTAVQAADRLAAGLTVAFLFAPTGRFGYLALPAMLLLWPRLASGGLRENLRRLRRHPWRSRKKSAVAASAG